MRVISRKALKEFWEKHSNAQSSLLIIYPDYESQLIFVRAVLIHAEYDKETWKNDDWFEST